MMVMNNEKWLKIRYMKTDTERTTSANKKYKNKSKWEEIIIQVRYESGMK